jgi:hypothetical protein
MIIVQARKPHFFNADQTLYGKAQGLNNSDTLPDPHMVRCCICRNSDRRWSDEASPIGQEGWPILWRQCKDG